MRYLGALLVIAIVALILIGIAPAMAQSEQASCFERAVIVKHMLNKFNESPVAAGLAANGAVMELLSSPDGGTWSMILTYPNGTSCVMASGEAWMDVPLPKKGTNS